MWSERVTDFIQWEIKQQDEEGILVTIILCRRAAGKVPGIWLSEGGSGCDNLAYIIIYFLTTKKAVPLPGSEGAGAWGAEGNDSGVNNRVKQSTVSMPTHPASETAHLLFHKSTSKFKK